MTFERNQTFSFHGRDAQRRAEQLVREMGPDAVEIVVRKETETKVRLLRPAVLISEAELRVKIAREAALQSASRRD